MVKEIKAIARNRMKVAMVRIIVKTIWINKENKVANKDKMRIRVVVMKKAKAKKSLLRLKISPPTLKAAHSKST